MANRASGSGKNIPSFSTVPPARTPRSGFDRSYSHKTTIDSGLLYPVFHDEALPGDSFTVRPAFLARMSTPIRPYMDGIKLDWQFWAVPYRIVWTNFVKMMGERTDPADHNDYTVPQMVAPGGGHLIGSFSDYLGLPVLVAGITHSSLWHRAAALVYNEWYRDENLQDSVTVDLDDGPDDPADYPLRRRGKRKDYFSGALPFSQKGDPVLLPIGENAPVIATGDGVPSFIGTMGAPVAYNMRAESAGNNMEISITAPAGTPTERDSVWDDTKLVADLSAQTSATINAMRVAVTLQHLLERDARGGSRYIEQNLAHFGIYSEDHRLQRPELLMTGSMDVNPMPVPNTSAFGGEIGQLGAFVAAANVGRSWTKSFHEHTLLLGFVSIRAELTYQRGIERMMSRKTRVDHYFPDLAHLGEQGILSQELYADATGSESAGTGDWSVFGYQPRYEEYRHRENKVTGEFRSVDPASLDVWHLALDFGVTRPLLNAAFIEENPPISRIVVLTGEPEFLLDCYYKVKCVRPMPKYATPGLLRF